ncbi:MAG: agmatinase [Bradymonadales bacterium]|nr:agmatinase [Bradymonadales bacterium]
MNTWGFPVDRSGPRYLGAGTAPQPGAVSLLGVPYDGTTSYRPGARFGPDALRAASISLESYSPAQDRDLEEDIQLVDLGNLEVPLSAPNQVVLLVDKAATALFQQGMKPLLLGGEHSFTPGAVAAARRRVPDLVVVQLDAHADLRSSYLGDAYNHSCAMRRCLDLVGEGDLLQVGIRSGTREEFAEMRRSGRLIAPEPGALEVALERRSGRPVYLTIDLDVFDPSLVPGTGNPEPGGIRWDQFEGLLGVLSSRELVAADVVELAPALDPSGASSVLAAKVVREVALVLGPPRG